MPRLRDHERLAKADDSLGLPQDRLDAPRVLVLAGDLECALRWLDLVEANDTSLGLRDRLLREDDDVAVLQ